MSDAELQQRNRQLAEWITRMDKAMSQVVNGNRATAYIALGDIRREMFAATGVDYRSDHV